VLCTLAVVVPLVFGVAPVPRELPFSDNVAWLANAAEGDVVRVNLETGRIDARLGLDSINESVDVAQGYGSVLVQMNDNLSSIDLAGLTWGASVSAEGDLFVGDGVAYLVSREGKVESLDPSTLEPKGEVDLDATVSRPVVAGSRLVVPVEDGSVAVVEEDTVVERFEAGDEGDHLEVSLVGDEAVALNFTQGSLRRFDAAGDKVRPERAVDFEAPSGPVLVPEAAPAGPLWVASLADGELVGVDVEDGSTDSVAVTEPGSELVGPVVVNDRVYVVDVERSVIVVVDAAGPEVVEEQPIDIADPGAVEMIVVGDTVVVNDMSSASAVVVDEDGNFTDVDKYSEEGVATPLPDIDLASDSGGGADEGPESQPDQGGDTPPPPPPPPQPGPGQPPSDPGGEDPPVAQPPPTTTPPPPTTTPPTTDPQVDPPGAVGGLSASSVDGRVNLSWSSPAGPVDDYTIGVSPAINGQTSFTTTGTSYPFTSLANGTRYTFTVSARNEGGAGAGSSASATPGRAPSVSGVSAQRTGDRAFSVSFSYNAGGRAVDTCSVTVGGTTHDATCSGGSGSVSGISVGSFNTAYTFTANVGTSLGDANANGSARSANKPLTVDADPERFAVWNGTCTWNPADGGRPDTRPYYNSAVHNCPNEDGGPAGYLNDRTAVRATCRTSGESVTDDLNNASSTWVRVDGYGYMNTLWFTTWNNNPEANLPNC
jgi:hypothetical protein